jgi:predicted permease
MRDQLRDAWRGLRAAPGTTGLALLILTVGIAAATVTFSVVDAVALRRLPLPDPGRLVTIARVERVSSRPEVVALQDFFTWQAETPALAGLAAVAGGGTLPLGVGTETDSLAAWRITANLLDVVGVRPALGLGFTAQHEVAGQDRVVILSHALWTRRFGGDPGVIGRQVTFGKEHRQVVGVMPKGFTYPIGVERAADVWVPLVPRPQERDHSYSGRSYYSQLVGRLRAGATIDQVRAQVARATAAVVAAYPNQVYWKDSWPVVMPLHDLVVGPAYRWLVLVLGAVVLVLIIAYVNVANLLLARATVRARELAMRAALGASRARIARMLVLESLMLSLAAAGAGIALARAGVSIATANLPAGLARASTVALDLRVLGVAIAAAIVTGIVFGAMPAWAGSRADVVSVMKQGGGAIGAGRGRARWQRLLLVAELAFVVTLLVATALFVTSFINFVRTDLGFARRNLVGFQVSSPSLAAVPEVERYAAATAFVSDVLSRAGAVPGVAGAALVDGGLPLFGNMSSYSVDIPGYGKTTGADSMVLRAVTADYFDVMGMRFVSGRTFDGTEHPGSATVVIINEEAARRFFGGRNPVGESFTFRGPTSIVGVVRSVRVRGPDVALQPEMFFPLLQDPTRGNAVEGDLVVRLVSNNAGLVGAVQSALQAATGAARPPQPKDFDAQFRSRTADRRFNASLMAIFGALALAMGAAGVFGLTSFVVAQQTKSIGVRVALGATAGRIFRGVLAQSGRVLLAGLTLGLLGGWAVSRLLASVMFGVTGREVWLYGVVAGAIGATSLLATLLPARRASRVDPLVALRTD